MRKSFTLFLLCVAALPLSAQKQWTLQECVQHALENNISVQQSMNQVRQSEIELNTAQSSRLPSLSASTSENFSFGRSLTANNTYDNTNATSTSFNVGSDVPIFQGFRIKNNIAMGKLNLAAATQDLERIKNDISVSVAQAYVQILYSKEVVKVAENQVAIDSNQVARLEELLSSGRISAVEVAQQRAALAQSKYQLTQARNNRKLALLEMAQLLEMHDPEGFDIASPSEDMLSPRIVESADDIYAVAVEVKAKVKAEQTRLEVAKTRIEIAKGAHYPTISLSGGFGTNYYTSSKMPSSSFSDQMKSNFSQHIGVSMSLPIFTRFQTRNSVRSAELNYRNQQLQLENVRKSLYKEIQQAWFNAMASQEKFASSTLVVQSARESFELVTAKYELGKATITEFNESKNTLMRAESDLVQSRYEHLFQTRLLDFYKGIDINL